MTPEGARAATTLPMDYFDRLYSENPDPWRFRTSAYEREKYEATLAALRPERYARGLEVGCSIGVFTRLLADRCERLLAIDGSRIALAQARLSCAACSGVVLEQRTVPAGFPEGCFDLVVLSEVLYYLAPDDLDRLAERCAEALAPHGEVILCHWLGETDYPLSGREASDRFAGAMLKRLPTRTILKQEAYRLERLSD